MSCSVELSIKKFITLRPGLYIRMCNQNMFSYLLIKRNHVGFQKNCLIETVLLSTHSICLNSYSQFYAEVIFIWSYVD